MLIGYVITVKNLERKSFDFFAIDHASGGYPYWSSLSKNAEIFKTKEDAEQVLTSDDFTKNRIMSDGTICPPIMVHSGAGICNTKLSGVAEVAIAKLELVLGNTVEFFGEIKEPTGYIYK
jgi:hypothetical protein